MTTWQAREKKNKNIQLAGDICWVIDGVNNPSVNGLHTIPGSAAWPGGKISRIHDIGVVGWFVQTT